RILVGLYVGDLSATRKRQDARSPCEGTWSRAAPDSGVSMPFCSSFVQKQNVSPEGMFRKGLKTQADSAIPAIHREAARLAEMLMFLFRSLSKASGSHAKACWPRAALCRFRLILRQRRAT